LIKNASKIVGQPFIFYSKFPPCAYRHTRWLQPVHACVGVEGELMVE
jgi:hypothetical protein